MIGIFAAWRKRKKEKKKTPTPDQNRTPALPDSTSVESAFLTTRLSVRPVHFSMSPPYPATSLRFSEPEPEPERWGHPRFEVRDEFDSLDRRITATSTSSRGQTLTCECRLSHCLVSPSDPVEISNAAYDAAYREVMLRLDHAIRQEQYRQAQESRVLAQYNPPQYNPSTRSLESPDYLRSLYFRFIAEATRREVSPPARPEILAARRQRQVKRKQIITARGMELLQDTIGEEAFRLYRRQGYVDVPSSQREGRLYRIRPHRKRIAIVERKGRQWVERQDKSLCIHPQGRRFVEGDEVAALVLLARFDEPYLLRKANVFHSPASGVL